MLKHLKSIGGSPYLEGESWDPSKFSITNIFKKEPASALHILLNYKFEAYKVPLTAEAPPSHYGMKKMDLWGSPYKEDDYNDIIEMLEDVNKLYLLTSDKIEIIKSHIRKAVDQVIAFRKVIQGRLKLNLFNILYIFLQLKGMVIQEDFAEEYNLTSIKTLIDMFDTVGIDYLKLINMHRFGDNKLTEDDYVYVQGIEGLKWRLEALGKIDKGFDFIVRNSL